ncbi:exonuclease [Aureococcus anophagefferens]|nr:exonuclease [Aureococcus anophagefferens]
MDLRGDVYPTDRDRAGRAYLVSYNASGEAKVLEPTYGNAADEVARLSIETKKHHNNRLSAMNDALRADYEDEKRWGSECFAENEALTHALGRLQVALGMHEIPAGASAQIAAKMREVNAELEKMKDSRKGKGSGHPGKEYSTKKRMLEGQLKELEEGRSRARAPPPAAAPRTPPPAVAPPSQLGADVEAPLVDVEASSTAEPDGTVAKFVQKVWTMVENRMEELINWSDDGKRVVITDPERRFAHEVCPRYFSHNTFTSFVRSLNLYGFQKLSHPERRFAHGVTSRVEFCHRHFKRGRRSELHKIARNKPAQGTNPRGWRPRAAAAAAAASQPSTPPLAPRGAAAPPPPLPPPPAAAPRTPPPAAAPPSPPVAAAPPPPPAAELPSLKAAARTRPRAGARDADTGPLALENAALREMLRERLARQQRGIAAPAPAPPPAPYGVHPYGSHYAAPYGGFALDPYGNPMLPYGFTPPPQFMAPPRGAPMHGYPAPYGGPPAPPSEPTGEVAPELGWSELPLGRWKRTQLKKLWADGAGIEDWGRFRADNFVLFHAFSPEDLKRKYEEMEGLSG